VANVDHWPDTTDPTVRLVRAIAGAAAAEPALNAWFDAEREAVLRHDKVDLGLAVDTPDGLFVPVIRDAGSLDDTALSERLETLKHQVADRSIAREDLSGQTITLSNFGMIAGRHANLVVMPPQVAILGAGRITAEPVATGGTVTVCRMLPLSLTFDHRPVNGGEAARFMAAVIAELENHRPVG
jgi:2-oxoisovalerate dehydrogenase E2 component (dihydrolipoyl transacylase)